MKEVNMTHPDKPTQILDLIVSFGRKRGRSSERMNHSSGNQKKSMPRPQTIHEHRLVKSQVRPTVARTSVLIALENEAPRCLDVNETFRILSAKVDGLSLASIYRALNDLWTAGILVRVDGLHGRALYAVKPDKEGASSVCFRCHCGARMVFFDDAILHEQIRRRASGEGFVLDSDSLFSITINCVQCRSLRPV